MLAATPRDEVRARTARLYLTPKRLISEPLTTIERIATESRGDVVRLNLGVFRPHLVLRPEHVQYVLRDNASNYLREGLLWKAIRRLVGDSILGEGEGWVTSRKIMNPLFSAKHIESLFSEMTDAITEAVDEMDERIQQGPVDAAVEMTRIVHRTVIRVFFGNRISIEDTDRLAPAMEAAATSITSRLIVPFVPIWVPMPGDRKFKRATAMIDDVMLPLVAAARNADDDTRDVVSAMFRAQTEDGQVLSDRQVRDNIVSVFGAGTETTGVALTWLWVALHDYPDVAKRVYDEIDSVIGSGPVNLGHIAQLRYTKMVLQELLRIYAAGWLVPRTAKDDDEIDGVRIKRGDTVIVSPYFTHRMDWLWESPHLFDPERFAPELDTKRHPYAYFPFGGGAHRCLGAHFFTAEAQLIIASVLSRYRPTLHNREQVVPQVSASLRPKQRVTMTLTPVGTSSRPRTAS